MFFDELGEILKIYLGIDVKYLTESAVTELESIDDVGRKVLHVRRMILRTQACLKAVDKVNRFDHFSSTLVDFANH